MWSGECGEKMISNPYSYRMTKSFRAHIPSTDVLFFVVFFHVMYAYVDI